MSSSTRWQSSPCWLVSPGSFLTACLCTPAPSLDRYLSSVEKLLEPSVVSFPCHIFFILALEIKPFGGQPAKGIVHAESDRRAAHMCVCVVFHVTVKSCGQAVQLYIYHFCHMQHVCLSASQAPGVNQSGFPVWKGSAALCTYCTVQSLFLSCNPLGTCLLVCFKNCSETLILIT